MPRVTGGARKLAILLGCALAAAASPPAAASIPLDLPIGELGPATYADDDEQPRALSPVNGTPTPATPRTDACPGADDAPTAESAAAAEQAVLCLVNAERKQQGLRTLDADKRLRTAARAHARDMVQRAYFAHESPDGRTITDRIRATGYLDDANGWTVGENLAWGAGALSSPRSIVVSWMNSAGHRENLLRRSFREAGFGVVEGNPRKAGRGATYAAAFGGKGTQTIVKPGAGADQPGSEQPGGERKPRRCGRIKRKLRRATTPARRAKHRRALKRCRKAARTQRAARAR